MNQNRQQDQKQDASDASPTTSTLDVGCSTLDVREAQSLRQQGILLTTFNDIYNWGRTNSIWPLQFGLACCAIEMIAVAAARFDIARFGAEIFRASPRQADLMIVSGTVTKKMAPQVVRIWNQMAEPKYCIAMGACSISGGPFKQGYNVLKGVDRFIPVDVYIPAAPPVPKPSSTASSNSRKKCAPKNSPVPAAPATSAMTTTVCIPSPNTANTTSFPRTIPPSGNPPPPPRA